MPFQEYQGSFPLSFYYVRHGESTANLARIIAGGGIDSPLTGLGQSQAKQTAQLAKSWNLKPPAIYHSPLIRAKQTAEIIAETISAPLIALPDLSEHFLGDWEGRPHSEIERYFNDLPDPPHGETRLDFFSRIKRALRHIFGQPGPPLIVAHGGVWHALHRCLGAEHKGWISNAALYKVQVLSDGGAIQLTTEQLEQKASVIKQVE
ncbi:MAG: histidine phosphatase family protein [Dongiaceae bacterium]